MNNKEQDKYALFLYFETDSNCGLKLSILLANDNCRKPNKWYQKNETIIDPKILEQNNKSTSIYEAYEGVLSTVETIKKHYSIIDCDIGFDNKLLEPIKLDELKKQIKRVFTTLYGEIDNE